MNPLTDFLCRRLYPVGSHPNPAQSNWEAWTVDYEFVHQLVLKALIEDTSEFLPEIVYRNPIWIEPPVPWVPSSRLFDVMVGTGRNATWIEIKTWAKLTDDQIGRQVDWARQNGQRIYYLLLCDAAMARSHAEITSITSGIGEKISYRELLHSLSDVGGHAHAQAYRIALLDQRARLRGDPDC
jgi:hypothetical protein